MVKKLDSEEIELLSYIQKLEWSRMQKWNSDAMIHGKKRIVPSKSSAGKVLDVKA
jgi:hypothetical protein